MTKDEILEKSRKENNNTDIYEKEVIKEGGNYASLTAAVLASLFFIIQVFLGEGMNYGLYAIVFSIPATEFVTKAIRLKKKHEIACAIFYIFCVLMFTGAHIYSLITASTI